MRDARDQSAAKWARRQHGLWTLSQAIEAGFTRHAIRRRLESGQWHEVDTRVYRVTTGVQATERQILMARVLTTGGVASGRSAAALYGWLPTPKAPEVTVHRGRRRNSHQSVRSTDALPGGDVTSVDGIPATSPTRTLIDLGCLLPLKRFEDLFDEVVVSGTVTLTRTEKRARELQCPRRKGCGIVLALIAESHPEILRSRNGAEAKLLRAISRLGMPQPRVNFPVHAAGKTRFLDLAWEEPKIFAELDGFFPHSNREVFEDDRTRQNDLVALHWRPFRITWTAFERSPKEALAQLKAALEEAERASVRQ